MPLEYSCPHCGFRMSIEREEAGREFVCPGCRVFFTLPALPRMTKREARRKLLPLAIFLAIEGGVCLLIGLVSFVSCFDPPPQPNDVLPALITIFIFALVLGGVLLAAARATFRAENRILIAIGFGVGGILAVCCCWVLGFLLFLQPGVLTDPLLRQAIDDPE